MRIPFLYRHLTLLLLVLVLGRTFLCASVYTQKVILGVLKRLGAVLHAPGAFCCAPFVSLCPKMRVFETRTVPGPCAHSQARGVLFGQIRLISHLMLVFL